MVILYPWPETEPISEDYAITLNETRAAAYRCRVSAMPYNTTWPGYQRPIKQTELASFLSFDMTEGSEPAYIQIDVPRDFKEVVVRPLSKKVRVSFEQRSISLTIFKPGQYTVEVDGHHNALHIFANRATDYGICPDDQGVIYFGPGVHRPGPIELKSNQTLYVAAGAVVHTTIIARGQRNIRILGGGILDNSEYHRTTYSCFGCPTCLQLFDCENVEVRGVTFRDACAWTFTAYNCRNVFVENAKTIGMWRYNSDGFDMVNSSNVTIKDCFLRNFDDCIVLKGFRPYDRANVENVIVSGCVIWCDWGRALEIGAETCADEYRHILFTDCDVIRSTHIALDVQNSGYANVHSLIFENIRVEYSKHSDEPIYQRSMDAEYAPKPEPHMAHLLFAEVHAYYHDMICPEMPNGRTTGVIFRDIQAHVEAGLPTPPSLFKGLSEECDTRGIRISNLCINGKRADSLDAAGVRMGAFASDVTIE